MPYFITDRHPDCSAWATVKEDGELLACHATEQEAIDQMVAVSLAEEMQPGGTYEGEFRAEVGSVNVGDYVYWMDEDEPEFGEVIAASTLEAQVQVWDDEDNFWFATEETKTIPVADLTVVANLPGDKLEDLRQVDLTPPAYMRAAARRGLAYHAEGKSGDGVVDATIREARAMANGNVTADKWVRIAAWIARHLVDLDAPAANPSNEDYPSAGVVAHLLWGSGPSKAAARRAMEYAQGVVARIEAENEGRAKGEALSKLETRVNSGQFEVRETQDGMTFEGYAAVFNAPSEPLPFIEKIERGAFSRSLKTRNDIKLLWNHESGQVLASTRAKTLSLVEDERGLKVTASLPNTTLGRDTAELLRRGDVDSMSFGFSVIKDTWNAEGNQRTLNAVRLHEVSIVAFPAYSATAGTTSVRALDKAAQRANVDVDALADALLKIENGEDITSDDRNLLSSVIESLSPAEEAEQLDADMLALKRKKLALLKGI